MPTELESSRSKLVYLYLQVNEGATIDEIKENLNVQLITLYGILKRLHQNNLVEKMNGRWWPAEENTDPTAQETRRT